MRKLLLLIFTLTLAAGSVDGQIFKHQNVRKTEKSLSGRSSARRKEPKVREPRTVLKAKKKQEANEKKLKNNYNQSIKDSQKRTIEIQTPEVQERMKQNKKDIDLRDKTRKKKVNSSTKKAGKKYR